MLMLIHVNIMNVDIMRSDEEDWDADDARSTTVGECRMKIRVS